MNVCNVVYDKKSQDIKDLKDKFGGFVDFLDMTYPKNNLPTLYYGNKVASEMYGQVRPQIYKLADKSFWSYSNEEIKGESWVEDFIKESFERYFNYKNYNIDVIFNNGMLKSVIDGLISSDEFIILNNGKYEIYICECSNTPRIWSVKKDNLKYAGIDYNELLLYVISKIESRCIMFDTDEVNLLNFKNNGIRLPFFLKEMEFVRSGNRISIESIIEIFNNFKVLTKQQLLVFLSKMIKNKNHDLLFLKINDELKDHNDPLLKSYFLFPVATIINITDSRVRTDKLFTIFESYNRMMRSAVAEKIYESTHLVVDRKKLALHISDKKISKIIDGLNKDDSVNLNYHSRDCVTYRIFSKNSGINFINENSETILNSILSRFGNSGIFCCIDFNQFEMSIINGLLNAGIDYDIHSKVSDLFSCSRSEAKKINNSIFHGASSNMIVDMIGKYDGCNDYIDLVAPILNLINEYKKSIRGEFEDNGYVTNISGRRIFSDCGSKLFSNVIQSTGSEILIDKTIDIYNKTDINKISIMFQRFDSIYFDIKKEFLVESINLVKKVMASPWNNIKFNVSIKVGDKLTSLKVI